MRIRLNKSSLHNSRPHGNPVTFWHHGLATLLAWTGSISLMSASPNFFVRSWQAEQGLPQNKVTAVVQTHDGYLWVGTYSGLARFDGVRFTIFDENNTPQMRSSRVTSLFETGDGTLWIGDESGQVTQYKDGQFKAVSFHPGWAAGKIYDIAADDSGNVWMMNEAGQLARANDGRVLTPEAGSVAKVVDMARSTAGRIWVSRDGRVSSLENGRLQTLQFDGTANATYVQGIGASRDGGLWVASDGRIRKWKNGEWAEDLGDAPWGRTLVTRLVETRNGTLAAGSADRGLFLVFPGKAEKPLHFDHTTGAFSSDWVISLCEDQEGNLWVGTGGGGLVILRPSCIQPISPPDQWQNRSVLSVCPGHNDGLWIGTEGAGLYLFQNGNWANFGSAQGIRNYYIWSLAEDPQGRLWAGTWGGGLFVQDGMRFEVAPGLTNVTMPMPALLRARDGGLWIGTAAGLLHYHNGQTNWFNESNGKPLRDVRTVAEDNSGTIWFGMAGDGLARLKGHEIQRFSITNGLSSDFIECLHLDKTGALWIGTFGGGLDRYKNGRFSVINRKQGLPNSVIGDIEEDDQGFFWMSSHDGIIRVSGAELNRCADGVANEIYCQSYGINDGMPTIECSEGLQPAGCKTPDGRLWFSTSKGLVAVNPQAVETNPLPPPVQIETMQVDDQPLIWKSGDTIQIPPGRHRFEFQYTGLSFVDPDKVRFRYRLGGLETEWVDAGAKRTVNYNYLPPGHYSFQVVACNNDGIWNTAGTRVSFTVLPYFWQTLWFRILAWIAIVTASGGLVWFDTRRRMRRKLERLEWQRAVEHERARIAHDIHDDLGAHLTRISMLSESARGDLENPDRAAADLDQIYDTAREVTRAMDEIVWAVNPRHDTLESLASYLEKFAQDLLAAAGIRCRLDLPMEFPPWRLTADVRHNSFLAFKEALHNVAQHSGASETYIRLAAGTASFELVVEDNGRGFVPGAARASSLDDSVRLSSGNGLENMRRRLAEIRGTCDIQSASNQGTKVTFTVPVKIVA